MLWLLFSLAGAVVCPFSALLAYAEGRNFLCALYVFCTFCNIRSVLDYIWPNPPKKEADK